MWANVQFALNKHCALEVYGVFAVYHLDFSSKQFQSCNKSLINQACLGLSWENMGLGLFFVRCQDFRLIFSHYGPHAWLIRYIYIYNTLDTKWCSFQSHNSVLNEWMNECIYIPHLSHIVSRRFTILIEWDRTSACKGASGCRYQVLSYDLNV